MIEPLPEIEKNIPVPSTIRTREGSMASLVKKMEVGDSISATQRQRNSAFASAWPIKIKLVSRTQPDGSVRIWRIK